MSSQSAPSFAFGAKHAHLSEPEQDKLACYYAGLEDGMRAYAWWKDGAQWVGTCGTSLRTAIRNMDEANGLICLHPNTREEEGVEYCFRCGTAK